MVRKVYHSLLDNLEVIVGKRDKSAPPRRLIKQTGISFGLMAQESIRCFLDLAEPKPDAYVLEVGCGCGYSARWLTRRLSESGRYWGFDVDTEGIAWCQKHLEAKHPNFHFQLADIYDKSFRPKGRFKPLRYRFPYLDDYFDLVLIPATFTHMPEAEMQNYLGQVRRVLKPGGRCVISFFLLNDGSRRLLRKGSGVVNVSLANQNPRLPGRKRSAIPVSYEEQFVRDTCAAFGLGILEPIHFGNWCGREEVFHHPDILMAAKLPKTRIATATGTRFR